MRTVAEFNDNIGVRTAYVNLDTINGTGKNGRTHEMKNCERTINKNTKKGLSNKMYPSERLYA